MITRLFTVTIESGQASFAGADTQVTIHECDFAGIHFSRYDESDLIKWVRVAAKRIYGPHTQVIFLRIERDDQCTPKLIPSSSPRIPSAS
jgi:hypothetical protein